MDNCSRSYPHHAGLLAVLTAERGNQKAKTAGQKTARKPPISDMVRCLLDKIKGRGAGWAKENPATVAAVRGHGKD